MLSSSQLTPEKKLLSALVSVFDFKLYKLFRRWKFLTKTSRINILQKTLNIQIMKGYYVQRINGSWQIIKYQDTWKWVKMK